MTISSIDLSENMFVFDLDHTLAIPDDKFDKEHCYLNIDNHVPIPQMQALLNFVMQNGAETMILTNRHPCLRSAIEARYGVKTVCRDYSIDLEENKHISGN